MSQKVILSTTQDEIDALWSQADGRAGVVRINREALQHLLMDHAALTAAMKSSTSFQLIESQKRGHRRKLEG